MNDKLKEWIEHSIDIEKYGNSLTSNLLLTFEDFEEELLELIEDYPFISSKDIYTELLDEIEVILSEYEKTITNLYKNSISKSVVVEKNWIKDFGKSIGKKYVIPTTLLSTVLFMPITDKSDYKSIIKNETNKLNQSINSALKLSYITKEITEDTANRIKDKIDSTKRMIETDSKTINTAVFRETDYLIFGENGQRVVYSSILDSRTCLLCGSYSGVSYDITKAPIVPQHENCRCSLIPEEIAKGENVKSYSNYLKELSDDELYKTLGKGRFNLYKKGIPINSFVNDNSIISIKELNEKYSDIV